MFVPSKRDLGVDGVEDDGEEVIEVIQNEKKNANGINDEDEDDDECEDSEITVKFHLVSLPASPVTPSRKEDSEVDTISTQQAQIRRGLDIFESHIRPRWCRTPQGRSGRSTRENSVDSLSSSPTTSPTTSTLEKKRGQIDTFLIGWKGIDYIGQKQESDRDSFDDETEDQTQVQARLNGSARKGGCGSAKLASKLEADREREQAQARAKEFVSGASEWDNLSEQKQNDIVQLWRSLPSLVPSAQKFGTLSLPLSLLKLLSTTTSPTSSGVTPSKNSDPSSFEGRQAEISGKVVDHIEATTLQHDTAEAHASVAARDANADESTKAASRVAHTEDYHLLERFIATPPNGSSSSPSSTSTKNENELGNGNEIATDHSSKANGSTAKESRVRGPSVNILNTPDCHHLPRELMQFASENGIELWAGGGGEGSGKWPLSGLLSLFLCTRYMHSSLLNMTCLKPPSPSSLSPPSLLPPSPPLTPRAALQIHYPQPISITLSKNSCPSSQNSTFPHKVHLGPSHPLTRRKVARAKVQGRNSA